MYAALVFLIVGVAPFVVICCVCWQIQQGKKYVYSHYLCLYDDAIIFRKHAFNIGLGHSHSSNVSYTVNKPANKSNDQYQICMEIILIGTFPSLYIIIVLVYRTGDRL